MAEETPAYEIFQDLLYEEIIKPLEHIRGEQRTIALCYPEDLEHFVTRAFSETAFHGHRYQICDELYGYLKRKNYNAICYLCRDNSAAMAQAMDALKNDQIKDMEKYLYVMKQETVILQKQRERARKEAKIQKLSVLEWHPDIIPLGAHSFVIPSEDFYDQFYVRDKIASAFQCIRSLLKIQLIKGAPPKDIVYFGPTSRMIYKQLLQQRKRIGEQHFNAEPQFHEVYLIDRSCDLITPMLTQMTYAGYIDEKYGMDYGYVEIEKLNKDKEQYAPAGKKESVNFETAEQRASKSASRDQPAGEGEKEQDEKEQAPKVDLKYMLLSDRDGIYKELRCLPMDAVGEKMAKMTNGLQTGLSDLEKPDVKNSIEQWKSKLDSTRYLIKLKAYVEMHLDLAFLVGQTDIYDKEMFNVEFNILMQEDEKYSLNFIRQLFNRHRYADGLRLLALYSQAVDGLDLETYIDMQRRVAASYGYEQAYKYFSNLEKSGLIKVRQGGFFHRLMNSRNNWTKVCNKLRCVVAPPTKLREDEKSSQDEMNEMDKKKREYQVAQKYKGYIPIIARVLAKCIGARNRKDEIEDLGKLLNLGKDDYGWGGAKTQDTEEEERKRKEAEKEAQQEAAPAKETTDASEQNEKDKKLKKILVFVVGGITEAELAVLQDLQKLLEDRDNPVEIHVGSTDMITGKKLITTVCRHIEEEREGPRMRGGGEEEDGGDEQEEPPGEQVPAQVVPAEQTQNTETVVAEKPKEEKPKEKKRGIRKH